MLKQCMSQHCPTHACSSFPRQPGDRRRTGRAPQEMGRANGTVRPSDMPMTMSRIVFPDVKSRSTWRVTGIAFPWCSDDENPAAENAKGCRATAASVTADSAFLRGEPCRAWSSASDAPATARGLFHTDERNIPLAKPQISNCLHVGGAAHSLLPAWCGSTKCSEHQCPLLGARWSCSFNRRVTTAWKCIRSFCVTTDLR